MDQYRGGVKLARGAGAFLHARYGVLSDLHGNLSALYAAVRRLRGERVDRWLCAGDLIDYGPQPNECVAELAGLEPVCIAGNHEPSIQRRGSTAVTTTRRFARRGACEQLAATLGSQEAPALRL
jgi:hypothetical protein